jgi:superfamily II DNA or RNA helicase
MRKPQQTTEVLPEYSLPLKPFPRFVLHACALIDEEVAEPVLTACLLAPELMKSVPPPCAGPEIHTVLQELAGRGLVDENNRCTRTIREIAGRDAAGRGYFSSLVSVIQRELPTPCPETKTGIDTIWSRATRDLRIALYSGNETAYSANLLRLLELKEQFPRRFPENPLVRICGMPFAPGWFSSLPPHVRLYSLHQIFMASLLRLQGPFLPLKYLESREFAATLPAKNRAPFSYLLLSELLLRGETGRADALLAEIPKQGQLLGLHAWREFLAGNTAGSIARYEKDLVLIKKNNENSRAYFTGIEGLFYPLALLKEGCYSRHPLIKKILSDLEEMQPRNPFLPAYTLLVALSEARENRLDLARDRLAAVGLLPDPHSITSLFLALAAYWIEGKPTSVLLPTLKSLREKASACGYLWLAEEYAALLRLSGGQPDSAEGSTAAVHPSLREQVPAMDADRTGEGRSLATTIAPEEQWLRALRALDLSAAPAPASAGRKNTVRLAWLLAHDSLNNTVSIQPRIQSLTTGGHWSKGRGIALGKLCRTEPLPLLTAQDQRVCAAITENRDARETSFHITADRALPALIGHAHVFLADSPKTPVEILRGEPELQVDRQGDFLHVRFHPFPAAAAAVVLRETPTRFRVYPVTDEHRRVATIIGHDGLQIPLDGRDTLFATLGNISSLMAVHSTVDGKSADTAEVEADCRIRIQLLPYGTGFRIAMFVRPLPEDGPYLKPGEGPRTIIARSKGQRTQTQRDLTREEENARFVEDSCPTLAGTADLEREWTLRDPEECLQLLLELQNLSDKVVVEWPEGERLTISPPTELNQFLLNIRRRNNWFEVDGTLHIDNSLVLDMRKLLDLARTTKSRFIPLGQGHFLTLSRELRRRLDEVATFAELRKNTMRLHPLAALALKDLTGGVGTLRTDEAWQEQERRLRKAQEFEPQVPSTLRAALREYQREGFTWLARLSRWGVGACLADDMGLGKTVQALALVLDRAAQGPTLVVAPTSVCPNWQEEAHRFAPTLKVALFGGRKRREMLSDLGPFDLLICSYGLLQQETELLCSGNWQTIILDEAQAIKNFITKRSRAAMLLNGRFKMITTGTPIENHLPELWNLFEFINPGLLGSLSQFNQRFAVPIERHNDTEAKKKLKKLISPFIMRRLKSQVLEELPARTEILLQVEMTEKEAALYAALRQGALERLHHSAGPPGKRSLQILREIMRLRRACCNPRLVLPETDIPSAKLALFAKMVEELRENGHKALVFSQFVDHLTLIRGHLDKEGIPYRYLDGSTPSRERQRQIRDFQAGQGDLFLISLKAGGLGLNLTAADYVIHMDPWWNPAVEDQASDRAHRIGQQRPVTIYRLVMKNSIEEKIVRLHQEKRDLANSLLENTATGFLAGPAELLRLLQEN